MFRPVTLPNEVKGRLLLHSMPGRYENWPIFLGMLSEAGVNRLVCLAELEEIRKQSPSYFQAIEATGIPCTRSEFPIKDFGVPQDQVQFAGWVELVAGYLNSGETVLLHCAGGIGRTGMFATCVLHALGMDDQAARTLICGAGSGAETNAQRQLVAWHAANWRLCR